MSVSEPPLPALDEVRELNRLFLGFLCERPAAATGRFGLSPRAAELLARAPPDPIHRAASFPRALFRFRLPEPAGDRAGKSLSLPGSGERVLELVLLHSARNLSRTSGYAARLLFWLDDDAVDRLRTAAVSKIVSMSLAQNVICVVFDDLDWIWQELLTEARPEYRRRLLLLGFQPDSLLGPAIALA